jgi:radical SAM protein with 4Fe4S-binding SPASM domain
MDEDLSIARTNSFEVRGPWLARNALHLKLLVHESQLLGSRKHFLRFDLYPLYAPSYYNRHHGFWDIPLKYVRHGESDLALTETDLILKNRRRDISFKPSWKGALEFVGYCDLHVSLWDRSSRPPHQTQIASSKHVLFREGQDMPLIQAFLPVTQRCNLSCPMCMRHSAKDFQLEDVPPEVLNPVLDASPHLYSVVMMGIGEPLLNKNFCDILAVLKRRMSGTGQVGLTTNGTLMTRELGMKLVDQGINWICFSLDGATRETGECIRPGLDFERLLRNISSVCEYRRLSRPAKLWLTANFVIAVENAQEIPAFVELASSLGLDSVAFSHRRNFRTGLFEPLSAGILMPLFEHAQKMGERHGVNIMLPLIHPRHEARCQFMEMAYVRLSGDVVPCCRMLEGATPGPVKIFGNVRTSSLLEIWHGAEYSEFRSRVLGGDLPHECQGCDYSRGMVTL